MTSVSKKVLHDWAELSTMESKHSASEQKQRPLAVQAVWVMRVMSDVISGARTTSCNGFGGKFLTRGSKRFWCRHRPGLETWATVWFRSMAAPKNKALRRSLIHIVEKNERSHAFAAMEHVSEPQGRQEHPLQQFVYVI